MTEFDLPIMLTFEDPERAYNFIQTMSYASEDVIWEQRKTESNTVIVTILKIANLEEAADE